MTLDELVQTYKADPSRYLMTFSHDIEVQGFSTFYARYGKYPIGGKLTDDVFVIASIIAVVKDRGAFTRFLRSIHHLFAFVAVESVIDPRLNEFLLREGFQFTSPNVWWKARTA